jgi:hypothetical protein
MTGDVPRLVHYTCGHAAPLIIATGELRPNPAQTLLPEPVTWATDLRPDDVPHLDLALGLRGRIVRCDRLAHRFEVLDPQAFERWTDYARRQVRAGRLSPATREDLDATPGGLPRHWWVATRPVRIAIPAVTR